MKTIYLTSGPRGSGKSSYCKKILTLCPELKLIIRDEILVELFGTTSLNPYESGHLYAQEIIFKMLEKLLAREDVHIILDFWNGFPDERRAMIERLRELGADKIFCWQFHVPVNVCIEWFFQKPDAKGYSEFGIRNDHELYYELAREIRRDGFDEVFEIDPMQKINLASIIL